MMSYLKKNIRYESRKELFKKKKETYESRMREGSREGDYDQTTL